MLGTQLARASALLTALALTLGLGVALAGADDPAQTFEGATGQRLLDNDVTPYAHPDSTTWKQIAGARFPNDTVIEGSVTPFDAELRAVAFSDIAHGFAGGSEEIQCDGAPLRVPVIYEYAAEGDGDPFWKLSWRGDCDGGRGFVGGIAWISDTGEVMAVGGDGAYPEREPARQADCDSRAVDPGDVDTPTSPPALQSPPVPDGFDGQDEDEFMAELTVWRDYWLEWAGRLGAGGGTSPPPPIPRDLRNVQDWANDFIAKANAWIARTSKTYTPQRARAACEAAYRVLNDQAGRARVWRFDGDAWAELDNLPTRMRGLTAVDFDQDEAQRFGFAGGLGQLWKWENGDFKGPIDGVSAADDPVDNSAERWHGNPLRHRVRDITAIAGRARQFAAVTSGCCSATQVQDSPQLLVHGGGGWWTRDFPEPEQTDAINRIDIPDSLYSVTVLPYNDTTLSLSVIATDGVEQSATQRPSVVSQPFCLESNGADDAESGSGVLRDYAAALTRTELSSARLVAGGGDSEKSLFDPEHFDGSQEPDPQLRTYGNSRCGSAFTKTRGDGVPDWAVGELGSVNNVNGARGLIYTTTRQAFRPNTVTEPDPNKLGGYEPTDPDRVNGYLRARYLLADSYSLNSVGFVPGSSAGWAVGDHGALLCFQVPGCSAGVGDEPPPPILDQHESRSLPESSAFDAVRPLGSGAPGLVPPLDARPIERLPRPHLLPAGAPDPVIRRSPDLMVDVRQVVMSRDGSEGWAIGPSKEAQGAAGVLLAPALIHYDGVRWTACDPMGIGTYVAADPACEQVAPLLAYKNASGNPTPVWLNSIARVPVERDDDAANDDEFELVAVGSDFASAGRPVGPVMLRYHDGRWALEDDAARAVLRGTNLSEAHLAFTAPDDGWLLIGQPNQRRLYHWDGDRWISCDANKPACGIDGDRADLKPNNQAVGAYDLAAGVVAAGDRVFMYGLRRTAENRHYPFIIYHDRGGSWKGDRADGGLDPGFDTPTPDPAEQGEVDSMTVLQRADGGYEGWAVGKFTDRVAVTTAGRVPIGPPDAVALHLRSGRWDRFRQPGGPLDDYLAGRELRDTGENASLVDRRTDGSSTERMAMLPGPEGLDSRAYIAQRSSGRIFGYDPALGRWSMLPGERPYDDDPFSGSGGPDGHVRALAPDNRGGLWVTVTNTNGAVSPSTAAYFFRYSDRRNKPVFEEVPSPDDGVRGRFTGLAGDAEGRVWLATTSGQLYRYDRLMGWDSLTVPGWDPGRIVTRRSEMFGIAVAPNGDGVAVGEKGRVVDLSPAGVRLDDVSGTLCDAAVSVQPCGTSRDLRAAAIAPDGAALVGGDRLSLLWRPAGEGFRAIRKPPAPDSATITAISLPAADSAWVTVDTGQLYAGRLEGTQWHWTLENRDAAGRLINSQRVGPKLPLRAIAVNADHRGFAVGDQGVVLERTGDGDRPWRRVATSFRDHLTAVVLPQTGLDGTLVGGRNGLVLTYQRGRWAAARQGDYFGNVSGAHREQTGSVSGLALAPGSEPGELEAWAALEGVGPSEPNDTGTNRGGWANNAVNSLIHYSSHPEEALLRPTGRAGALPDAPEPRHGEISFAAFGNTACTSHPTRTCLEPGGTTADYEAVAQRVVDEIIASRERPGGPAFAVFTGDTVGETSLPGSDAAEQNVGRGGVNVFGPVKLRRWKEFVADRLAVGGVPLFGAIGTRDLSGTVACMSTWAPPGSGCTSGPPGTPGENLMWRTAFAGAPAPWGAGKTPELAGGAEVRPVADTGRRLDGHAGTHYAFDVVSGGKAVLRVVFADTSERSLAGGEAMQNPLEAQSGWLEQVLSSRPSGTKAIVVSTTPTYSYGPGALSDTQQDAASFEGVLLKNGVTALVSGHVGWNGLYWTLAPGVHMPCPGDDYPSGPPAAAGPNCGGQSAPSADQAAEALGDALRGLGPPASDIVAGGVAGESPVGSVAGVIAASAGAGFGPDNREDGEPRKGFWHGYTVVRVDPAADGELIVEQRPVFDWIMLRGQGHALRAGQKLQLQAFGREPVGMSNDIALGANTYPFAPRIRYDRIDSPSITHRYDLIEADPKQPWLPRVVENNGNRHGYVQLDPQVGTIDPQTGRVIAGRSSHGRIYALALLSVGQKSATWPLVFEPKRSYVPKAPAIVAAPGVPPIRVLGLAAASLQPPAQTPPAATPPPPVGASLQLPAPPALPTFPTAAAPLIAPPVPPAPPPPPSGQQAPPLDLSLDLTGITVPPTPGVTAQPTPPVNPAPPGGARKEARQKQAATAKSEEGGAGEKASDAAGDLVDRPASHGTPMTRRDRVRADGGSFTAVTHRAQPSAWTTGLQWGGGLTLMALAFALGWTTVRPTPRRGPEALAPAPAWARRRRY